MSMLFPCQPLLIVTILACPFWSNGQIFDEQYAQRLNISSPKEDSSVDGLVVVDQSRYSTIIDPNNASATIQYYVWYDSDEWVLHEQRGVMKGQTLRIHRILSKQAVGYMTSNTTSKESIGYLKSDATSTISSFPLPNNWHSCYHVHCSGLHCSDTGSGVGDGMNQSEEWIEVCYPAVIVTGPKKCGTSAMYQLLTRLPGAVTMQVKENCPSARRRSTWNFLRSLPRLDTLQSNSIIVDGCIDHAANFRIRPILRDPRTIYVVMLRNYADMLWSVYNYWCNARFDGPEHCWHFDRWIDPAQHNRSPQDFHRMIELDANNTVPPRYSEVVYNPFTHPLNRPCAAGYGFFTDFLEYTFYRAWAAGPHGEPLSGGLKNRTVVVASEDLSFYPERIARRVLRALHENFGYDYSLALSKSSQALDFDGGKAEKMHLSSSRLSYTNTTSSLTTITSVGRITNDNQWQGDAQQQSRESGTGRAGVGTAMGREGDGGAGVRGRPDEAAIQHHRSSRSGGSVDVARVRQRKRSGRNDRTGLTSEEGTEVRGDSSSSFAERMRAALVQAELNSMFKNIFAEFTTVRVNTQSKRGEKEAIPVAEFMPGRYSVSKNQPMLPETIALLNKCWQRDCRKLNVILGYKYRACFSPSKRFRSRISGSSSSVSNKTLLHSPQD